MKPEFRKDPGGPDTAVVPRLGLPTGFLRAPAMAARDQSKQEAAGPQLDAAYCAVSGEQTQANTCNIESFQMPMFYSYPLTWGLQAPGV